MTLCGREKEVQQIIADCAVNRLVVVTAAAGLGTTALLQWGVLPALKQAGYITLLFRDWQGKYFVTNLKDAIAEAVRQQADDSFFAEAESLTEMLERIRRRTGRTVALLLDHFEDYVRCHIGTDLSDSFDAELSNAIASHPGKFVLVVAEDSVKQFERFSQYIPNLPGHRLSLQPLTIEVARELVLTEAERRGLEVEPGVVEDLTNCSTVAWKGGVRVFLLARGLTRLLDTEIRLKSCVARRSTLSANGGPDRLILESLDANLAELKTIPTDLLFRWCNVFISAEQQRIAVTEKGLTEFAGKFNRFVPTTLPLLVDLGVLRQVETGEILRYEIAHECLTPILQDWWQRRGAAMLARQRAQFRVRSVSVAVGSLVAIYAIWLIWSIR
jgi:hypothetical protein